jgi:hypothetical protein
MYKEFALSYFEESKDDPNTFCLCGDNIMDFITKLEFDLETCGRKQSDPLSLTSINGSSSNSCGTCEGKY